MPLIPAARAIPRPSRRFALTLVPLLLALGACGGSSDDGLSRGQLEEQVTGFMTERATAERPAPDSVACEGGLSGDGDQRCVATVDDIRIGLTVTRDGDDDVDPVFDDGVLFSPEVIEKKLSLAITEQSGTLLDDVTCPEDLVGAPGQTTVCQINTRGQELPVSLTVTAAAGTDIQFDFEVEEPS